jgi:WD40 repeat protein
VPAATPRRQRLPLLIAAAATIVVGGLGYVLWRGQPDSNNRSVSLEQITESGDVVTAAISDDGKYVAYAEAVSDGIALNVRQVQTKAAVTIIPAGTHRYAGLAFSRDGQYLYVTTSAPSSLIRIPTLGGASTKLLDEITTSVSVSPDDRQLAFVRSKNNDAELVVASADGTSLRALAVQKRLPYGTPAWSPDGQSIAWPQGPLVTDATVTITSADGTRKEDLALAGWKYVDSVLWLPDGRGFVVTAEERTRELTGRHQVLEVSYPGLAIKRLTNDLGDYHSLTGDPKTALAAVPLAVRSGISVGPLAKPDGLRRVGTGSTDGVRGLTWAPDRRIVFTDVYSVGWIMNPDGSGLRPLLPDRQSAGFPFSCGSAVGYTQAGVAPALMVFLIDSNDGKPRHVIDIPYVRPTCTPDGAWLLYEDNETIKKVQTSGGEPATVHKDAHDPQVSPDGVFLAALTGPAGAPSFVIFSMKDNSMVRRLPGRAGANYRWDADSQALILSRGEGNVDNLWRLPIDGSPAVQLTQFTSDRIFTFSVGADRRLAVARGETAHDVVILRR